MKCSVLPALIALLTTLTIASCMKTSSGNTEYPDSTLITGRWQILRDSTYVGVGLGNHSEVYQGTLFDYFDIGDNSIEINEHGSDTTLKYTLLPNSRIIIATFGISLNGIPDTCTLTRPNPNALTITSTFFPTPGGIFGRKIWLRR